MSQLEPATAAPPPEPTIIVRACKTCGCDFGRRDFELRDHCTLCHDPRPPSLRPTTREPRDTGQARASVTAKRSA